MESPINLLKGDKVGSETDYRDALPVNMSGVIKEIFGAQGYMLQQPGLTKYGDGIGIDRGGLWNERHGEHYRVSGNSFVKVDAGGSSTVLGAISGLDTASMPYSFNTQGVLADGRFWLYDKTAGTFTEVIDANLGDPIDADWIDGYYIFTDGEYIYHTDISSETTIDPLKYATAEFSPDATLGVAKTADNKFRAFGRYTIEDFTNQANENFAFTRLTGRAIPKGIVGTHCKANVDDKWYIMGGGKKEDVTIYLLGVGSAQKVASREVDKLIGQYTEAELSAAVLEARTEKDYPYLIVHLPNETLLFNKRIADAAGIDQAWSILKTDVLGNAQWRAKHGLFEPRLGKWVYGDKRDNTLGILDDTVATHYGEISEWLLHTPFLFLDSASIDELEIETIPGFTTEDDAGVFISLTHDGLSHGTEWAQSYGSPSEYGKRFIVYCLGYVTGWVGIRLRGASRSRMAFSRAKINYG